MPSLLFFRGNTIPPEIDDNEIVGTIRDDRVRYWILSWRGRVAQQR